jgi:penicillin-binding protein 1A
MFKKLLKILLLAGISCAVVALFSLAGAYFYVSRSLPEFDTLEDYQPPAITRAYSEDGQTIAEFYKERRIVVPVNRMPKQLIQAFVAASGDRSYLYFPCRPEKHQSGWYCPGRQHHHSASG